MYFIDGYNLLFSIADSKESLQVLRKKSILLLQKKFAEQKLSGMVVFDGAHRREEESGLCYPSPLIIAYAPKGQSADEYIIEELEKLKNPKQATVVTNDKGLSVHARSHGAKIITNKEFIHKLFKPPKPKEKRTEPKDTKQNFERLLRIFEERLEKGTD